MKKVLLPLFACLVIAGGAIAEDKKDELAAIRSDSPKGAKSYIVQPRDGKTVKKKFKVIFGLRGMGIAPAGINMPDTGHHHLLVDVDAKDYDMSTVLPGDQMDKVKHFGKGQTETVLELAPGKHTLQLVFANFLHIPHNPPVVSEKITIVVE
ncbi:MAG: DUF4399 domain-containing protein [Verrucomicrobiota bacterium]